ncbi:unnamed protein product [Boreogadus saida]
MIRTVVRERARTAGVTWNSVTDSQKRRELLSRRPSYRKILNDRADAPGMLRIAGQDRGGETETRRRAGTRTSRAALEALNRARRVYVWASSRQRHRLYLHSMLLCPRSVAITRRGHPAGQQRQRTGLQTLTHERGHSSPAHHHPASTPQTRDGQQILVPSNQVVVQAASGDVQAYQIRTASASTIAPGVVMASSPSLPASGGTEEVTRKREVRLMKNREAARECRRKKKEYVKCLENRVAVLENQNKTLIEELKALKDLYCHKTE